MGTENRALCTVEGKRYRVKLRTLLERLPTLEHFAFCYLFRQTMPDYRKNMIRFVKKLEHQMEERLQLAKETGDKNAIPRATTYRKVPAMVKAIKTAEKVLDKMVEEEKKPKEFGKEVPPVKNTRIVMLKCPLGKTELDDDDKLTMWSTSIMELGTRCWQCSRDKDDY